MSARSAFQTEDEAGIMFSAMVSSSCIDELWTSAGIVYEIAAACCGLRIRPTYLVGKGSPTSRAVGILWLLLVIWLAPATGQGHSTSPPIQQPTEDWAVEAAFREAFQLWADGRFEALWTRGMLASRYRVAQEVFVRGMRHRVVQPACCWSQLRAVRVHFQGTDEAVVEAQVGMTVRTLGTTVVRIMLVYLRREEGAWRVALEDFLTKPEVGLPWGLGWPP